MDPLDLNAVNRLGRTSSPMHVPNPRVSNVSNIYTGMQSRAGAMNTLGKDGRLPNSAVFNSNIGKAIRESTVLPPSRESIPTTQPLPPLSHTTGIRVRSNSEETLPDTTTTINVPNGTLPADKDDSLSRNAVSFGPTTTTHRRRLSEATLPDETPDVSALQDENDASQSVQDLEVAENNVPQWEMKKNDSPKRNVSLDATQVLEVAENNVSLDEMEKNDSPKRNVSLDATQVFEVTENNVPLVVMEENSLPKVNGSLDATQVFELAEDNVPEVEMEKNDLPKVNASGDATQVFEVAKDNVPEVEMDENEVPLVEMKRSDLPQANVSLDATQVFEVAEHNVPVVEMEKNDSRKVNVFGDTKQVLKMDENEVPLVEMKRNDLPVESSVEPPKKKAKVSTLKKKPARTKPAKSPDIAHQSNDKHDVPMDTDAQVVAVEPAEQHAANSNEAPAHFADNCAMVAVEDNEQRAQEKFWEWDPAARKFTVRGEFAILHATDGHPEFKIPVAVYENLYDYQRLSVAWLAGLYLKKQGGILGDDMGLGKTVQVAAMLSGIWTSKLGYHFLIAVPVTLIENWRVELTSWCPGIPIYLLYGTQKERYDALKNVYRTGGVVLTSYDLVKSIIEDVKTVMQPKSTAKRKTKKSRREGGAFDDDHEDEEEKQIVEVGENHPWDVVVIDEAHRVKNAACKAARAIRHLQARTRIMLSGTPLQNNLKELWALMDICMPGLLGNRATFESGFSDPIAAGSKRDASAYAVQFKDHLSRRLKLSIRPYFLRRTKDKVNEMRVLPPKTDIVMWLKFCPEQERFYKMLLRSEVLNQARAHTGGTVGGIALFRSIRLLTQMCNHPLLCLKNNDYDRVLASWGNEVLDSAEAPDGDQAEHWDTSALKEIITDTAEKAAALSCKLRFLSVLLPALEKGGHRCLIFSQSTKMLNLVQGCVLRPLGLKFLRLDGTLHVEERNVKIAKFESPEGIQKFFCMCLSVQVGGVGLTLTSADRVVIVDPSWNPAVDMQAIDRTHRLGQTKPIVVYRLVGAGGIEDRMFRYQIFKRGVVKTLLEEENQTRYFTQKDMKDLFTYGEKTQTLMQEKGYDLESEHVVNTIAQDVGEVNQNSAFWGSGDLEGFADYSDLFSTLEQATELDSEAQERAKEAIKKLREEQYVPETYEPIMNTPAASGADVDYAECQLVAVDDQQPANPSSHQETPAPKKRKAWSKLKQS